MLGIISFTGRLGRLGYLGRMIVMPILLAILMSIVGSILISVGMSIIAFLLSIVAVPLFFLCLWGLTARRLHDMNMTGWAQLLPMIIGFVLTSIVAISARQDVVASPPEATPPVMSRSVMEKAQRSQLQRQQQMFQQQRVSAQQQMIYRQQLQAQHQQQSAQLAIQEQNYEKAMAERRAYASRSMAGNTQLATHPLMLINAVIQLLFGLALLLWPGTDGPNFYG